MSKEEGWEGGGRKKKNLLKRWGMKKKRSVKQKTRNERKTGEIADFNFLPF